MSYESKKLLSQTKKLLIPNLKITDPNLKLLSELKSYQPYEETKYKVIIIKVTLSVIDQKKLETTNRNLLRMQLISNHQRS